MSTARSMKGIFTIPSTPFKPDGEIDIRGFRRVVDFCVECGAHGLVFPVNASEFVTLSDQERFDLSEVLVEQNAATALTIAHRGYVLQTGRIILADSAEGLAANEDVRRSYLGEI